MKSEAKIVELKIHKFEMDKRGTDKKKYSAVAGV